jgi:hypothetical protein
VNPGPRSVSEKTVAELALDLLPLLGSALKSSALASINGVVTLINGMPCFPSSGWVAIFAIFRSSGTRLIQAAQIFLVIWTAKV